VRVEITVLSVVITFVRDKDTMRVEKTLERVVIEVSYLHAYYQNYSRVCRNHILRVKSHAACGNPTLRA
jgi:hypothetical protein